MHQFSPRLSSRTTIATTIFILCCLLSTARVVIDAPSPTRLFPDDIATRSDQRFAAVKAALPKQGIVGYIGDSGTPGDYYLAQYALAPLVVDNSPGRPLVVGNFSTPPPQSLPSARLQLLKDFGNGVLLFADRDAK
jgi:hypothetical protein